eukprot:4756590-Prymnesium_polylepis.1
MVPAAQWLASDFDANVHAGVKTLKSGFPQASGIQTRSLTCSHPGKFGCSAHIPAPAARDVELCNSSFALARLRTLSLVCTLPNRGRLVPGMLVG